MRDKTIATRLAALLLALAATTVWSPGALAVPSYGPWVDGACEQFNGTSPYTQRSCELCHTADLGQRVDPEWTWWEQQTLTNFCPDVVNRPPNGSIDQPGANVSITAGDSVTFRGSATDLDGDTQLAFLWTFGGAAPQSTAQNPGNVTFATPGTFNVTLTVTDSAGASDPTPASRTVRVADVPPTCTDGDGDGFAVEGGSCGQVDCNDADPGVNPGAEESCSDGIDNNCNGLVDDNDPVAVGCPVVGACTDGDGDGFNNEGGVCGPVDCDDGDSSITVQCLQDEACRAENACLEALFAPPGPPDPPGPVNVQAEWDALENKLEVDGSGFEPGTTVSIFNAVSGALIGGPGVPVVLHEGRGEFEFELRNPGAVPCRVRAVLDGSTFAVEADVRNAPADCDDGAPPPPPPPPPPEPEPAFELDVTRASWDRRRERLTVRGEGAPPGATVVIRSASDPSIVFGTTTAENDGGWEFRASDPDIVPCRVLAEADDARPDERDVRRAPRNCDVNPDPSPPPPEPEPEPEPPPPPEPMDFTIERARWDAGEGEFKVEGRSSQPGATVTVRDAANPTLILGRTTVEGNGEWELELDSPPVIPCRVRVEIGGGAAERDVEGAPGSC